MTRPRSKTVLFLCTGNYYRSRFAEIVFNSVAAKMGLPWQATSRGLALERGVNNHGPIAPTALQGLRARGIDGPGCARLPLPLQADELQAADRVVALKETEHLPLLVERFPSWGGTVEYWAVNDADGVLDEIEREVLDLAARLITGAPRSAIRPMEVNEKKSEPPRPATKTTVRIGRETKGRRGKGVTIVSDLPLDETALQELAATLKQRCGTGGTVKDGHIEIQGDHRDRLGAELEKLGYRVKRVGA